MYSTSKKKYEILIKNCWLFFKQPLFTAKSNENNCIKRVTIFSAYNFILQNHNRQSKLIFMCMLKSFPLGNKKTYTKVSSRGLSALFVSKLHNIKILSAYNTEKIISFVPYKHLLFTRIFWCFLIQHSVENPSTLRI